MIFKKKHLVAAAVSVGVLLAGGVAFSSRPVTPMNMNNIQMCQATIVDNNPLFSLPDPKCTPGVTNPAVTQDNIQQTICMSGYTKTIRPSVAYTNALKVELEKEYMDDPSVMAELDHYLPLELGGAPSDVKNLWPEVGPIPNPKDRVENLLHKEVCNGTITLTEAQKEITTNWVTVYKANFK